MNYLNILFWRCRIRLLSFIFLVFALTTYAQTPQIEREALMALYNATGGPNWTNNTNWGIGDPFTNQWYGVTCHENGSIRGVLLPSNNLNGTLPVELISLINLEYLGLDENKLSGSIPEEIGNLVNLRNLVLSKNQLSGSIPANIENLTKLTHLYLNNNNLDGNIPSGIGKCVDLQILSLNNNNLNGPIPPSIGQLTKLDILYLQYNQLSGSIPPEMGNLNLYYYLYLYNNNLSGPIPPEFGNIKVKRLNLSHNQLSGPIPPELGNMGSQITDLRMINNNFSGPIPKELGKLYNLKYLYLSNNNLDGSIPPELGNITSLYQLYLSHNQLSGPIPGELANLKYLYILYLDNNNLSGAIPPEFGNFERLAALYLNNNNLSESIPPELANSSSLRAIYFNDNNLSGSIPAELGNSNLVRIWLHNNNLSGSIPPEIGNLNLNSLYLQNNNLSGCYDPALKSLCSISQIDLSGNTELPNFNDFCNDGTGQCTVTPQSEIDALMAIYNATDGANWKDNTNWGIDDPFSNPWYGVTCNSNGNVVGLSFVQNNLNGIIPPEIKDLTHLTSFNSHYNKISSIPPEIGELVNLNYFRIAYYGSNRGMVSIPEEIFNLTGLTFLGLEGVELPEISPNIAQLTNLVTLQIFQNQISKLPNELFTLTKLQKLHLSWNNLTELPSGIGNLSQLRDLILSYNKLKTLPPEIGNLNQLYSLDIFHNDLIELPDKMGNLTSLQKLQADYNKLTSIPDGIFNLPFLYTLSLSNNNLSGPISQNYGNLSRMKYLNLSNNNLEGNIPGEIGNLIDLITLNLSNNNLSGCFPTKLKLLCGKNIYLQGNPDLPDFNSFCYDGTGECVPPVAECTDVTVFADMDCSAEASIDAGSYDVNGEPLALTQTPSGPYPLGETLVTLTVSDGMFSSECQATVSVVDNLPPVPEVIDLPNVVGECSVTIDASPNALDNCSGTIAGITNDPVYYDQQGIYTITWTYTDEYGNTSNQQQKVIVDDITPPVINTYPNPVITLTKGNHQYVAVTVYELVSSVTDNCAILTIDDISIIKVESDEEEDADETQDMNDGRTSDDMVISDDCSSVELIDEYNIKGNGRVYTIYLKVDDGNGNTTVSSAEVHVIKLGNLAIKDESQYIVSNKNCGPAPIVKSGFKKETVQQISADELFLSNYPNPFDVNTTIEFSIPERGRVRVELFDLTGQKLSTITDEIRLPGINQVEFDASGYSEGIYFYRLTYKNKQLTNRMIHK